MDRLLVSKFCQDQLILAVKNVKSHKTQKFCNQNLCKPVPVSGQSVYLTYAGSKYQ